MHLHFESMVEHAESTVCLDCITGVLDVESVNHTIGGHADEWSNEMIHDGGVDRFGLDPHAPGAVLIKGHMEGSGGGT